MPRSYVAKTRPIGRGHQVIVRLQPDLLAQVDAFMAGLPDPKLSRPEAIRRLVRLALDVT